MQLLLPVKKNKLEILNKISFLLSIVIVIISVFLCGNFTGFWQGEEYAISVYSTTTLLNNPYNFLIREDDYKIISWSYFIIFIIFSIISIISWSICNLLKNTLPARFIILLLTFIPIFEYLRIYELKILALQSDFQRFELFREKINTDIIGFLIIISIVLIQIFSFFLQVKKEK